MSWSAFYELMVSDPKEYERCGVADTSHFGSEKLEQIAADVKALGALYSVDIQDISRGHLPWETEHKDMLVLSTKHPDVLFIVWGKWEGSDDYWVTYYLNGKMQICQGEIVYPDFDISKLEEPKESEAQ